MAAAVETADRIAKKLKKIYGKLNLPESEIDSTLAYAEKAFKAKADFVEKHNVRFAGEVGGKRTTSVAEIVFARYGEGEEAAWVAFCIYDKGWTNVVRPFTKDTAKMVWLEVYVAKELTGNTR